MILPFKNILVQIESTNQAYIAVEKALELSDPSESCIHLVSIIRFDSVLQGFVYTKVLARQQGYFTKRKQLAEKKMEAIKNKILALSPQTVVRSSVMIETVTNDNLLKYTLNHQIDLVINTNKQNNAGFGLFKRNIYQELAKKANVAVLTVTKECLNKPIKSILLPVRSFVPERKIQVALAFAKKYNAHIHLVTLLNNDETDSKIKVDAFYLTYKILSEYGYAPQYKILQGADNDVTLLRYADQIKADLILVNPEKKNPLSGFMQHKMSDMLSPFSALHVLTLKPYLKRSI